MKAVNFTGKYLDVVDQRGLPYEEIWLRCKNLEDIAQAMELGLIRGYSTLVISSLYALKMELQNSPSVSWKDFKKVWVLAKKRVQKAIPSDEKLLELLEVFECAIQQSKSLSLKDIELHLDKVIYDFQDSLWIKPLEICKHSRKVLTKNPCSILTWAPPTTYSEMSLALVEILKCFREGHNIKKVYLGRHPEIGLGSLFTLELQRSDVPFESLSYSEIANEMQSGNIDYLLLAAESVAGNGDVVAEHGAYTLAILAHHHGIDLWLVATRDHLQENCHSGEVIVKGFTSEHQKAVDIIPSNLISGYITELGVIKAPFAGAVQGKSQKKRKTKKAC